MKGWRGKLSSVSLLLSLSLHLTRIHFVIMKEKLLDIIFLERLNRIFRSFLINWVHTRCHPLLILVLSYWLAGYQPVTGIYFICRAIDLLSHDSKRRREGEEDRPDDHNPVEIFIRMFLSKANTKSTLDLFIRTISGLSHGFTVRIHKVVLCLYLNWVAYLGIRNAIPRITNGQCNYCILNKIIYLQNNLLLPLLSHMFLNSRFP